MRTITGRAPAPVARKFEEKHFITVSRYRRTHRIRICAAPGTVEPVSVGFAEHFDQGILQSQRDADADADAPQNPHFLRLATIRV